MIQIISFSSQKAPLPYLNSSHIHSNPGMEPQIVVDIITLAIVAVLLNWQGRALRGSHNHGRAPQAVLHLLLEF